ncbi:MAG: hypothetical protein HC906_12575 [Bacteroidales bacterium]|nr:hypothetical protein [Bacteroidales bacterium]
MKLNQKKLEETVKERTAKLLEANNRLLKHQFEIKTANQFITSKNEELKKQKEQIEVYSKLLHEADQNQIKFLVNISHEFRTPLTLIINPLEQLLIKLKGSIEIEKHLKMMHNNAVRLLRLINQILDIRKFQAGAMNLKVEKRNLLEFITKYFQFIY